MKFQLSLCCCGDIAMHAVPSFPTPPPFFHIRYLQTELEVLEAVSVIKASSTKELKSLAG